MEGKGNRDCLKGKIVYWVYGYCLIGAFRVFACIWMEKWMGVVFE